MKPAKLTYEWVLINLRDKEEKSMKWKKLYINDKLEEIAAYMIDDG